MSNVDKLIEKQKRLSAREKKIAEDKKALDRKIKAILRNKQEKDNLAAGAALRELYAANAALDILMVREICSRYF